MGILIVKNDAGVVLPHTHIAASEKTLKLCKNYDSMILCVQVAFSICFTT